MENNNNIQQTTKSFTLRMANKKDLPELKVMYRKIITNMYKNNISIWDEIYPCEFIGDDIEKNRLYVLTGNRDEIVSAFALCDSNDGASAVKWENPDAAAFYLDRFGVHADYSRKGIGSIMLGHAISLTRQKEADYLRLFVVDINKPAIELYIKNGFQQVDGVFEEKIDGDRVLREYGFEIKV